MLLGAVDFAYEALKSKILAQEYLPGINSKSYKYRILEVQV